MGERAWFGTTEEEEDANRCSDCSMSMVARACKWSALQRKKKIRNINRLHDYYMHRRQSTSKSFIDMQQLYHHDQNDNDNHQQKNGITITKIKIKIKIKN